MSRTRPIATTATNFGRAQLVALGKLIRRSRERRNWSLRRLADESSVGIATIQKIESGQTSTNLLTVIAIAEALGEPLDRLISASTAASRAVHLVRGQISDAPDGIATLTEQLVRPRMVGRVVTIMPRASLAADQRPQKGPLFVYVVRGAIKLSFADGAAEILQTGDSIHVKEDVPSAWSNPLAMRSRAICLVDNSAAMPVL